MKKLFASALCVILALSLAACGASNSLKADNEVGGGNFYVSQDSSAAMDFSSLADSKTDGAESGTAAETNEKIIKTVELNIQTKEYDTYISALAASVTANGGYVETSENDMGGYANRNRYATYTVRIPADNLDAFLTSAGENGKIVSKTENQQNVTLEYVDLESRISAYQTEKATLTALLEKAESLENVLSIQERLSEVNYQIESYTSQLRVLENRVSYSTVTLYINEVERVTETEETLGAKIKNAFLNNVDNLGEFLSEAVVTIIGGLPIILPVGALAVAAILIVRKIIRKRRASKG